VKVLVTGASGLVGSFVARELLAQGHEVKLLLRNTTIQSRLQYSLEDCERVEGDILDVVSLGMAMFDCDAVVHCAGKVSFDPRKKKEIMSTNVDGTSNVANTCLKLGIKKLVHISSIAALGRKPNQERIDEKAQWEDSSLNSTYAKSKYLAELEVFRAGEEGLDFTILNPSIVLGPGDPTKSSTKLFSFIKKWPLFFPSGSLNVVDVRDVAKVAASVLHISHRDRLILNAQRLSYRDFYSLISQEAGLSAPKIAIPKLLLRFVAFFDSFRTFFVGGEPLVTKENLRFIDKHFTYQSLYLADLLKKHTHISTQESIKWVMANLYRKES
jgi:dihydroflavonol-4-reductase